MIRNTCRIPVSVRYGVSLLELLAVLSLLGLVAAIVLPRVSGVASFGRATSCYVLQGDIEVQAELWRRHQGSWPATNLADIGADLNYFPEGLPVCPVDGSSYTLDAAGHVVGHNHAE